MQQVYQSGGEENLEELHAKKERKQITYISKEISKIFYQQSVY